MADTQKRLRAAAIGDDALELANVDDRQAFIDLHCQGDAELARYVRLYLDDFKHILATSDSVMRSRGSELLAGAAPSSSPLQPLEQVLDQRYKLVRLAGYGGMGKVFEAYDVKADRTVAIKLIRSSQVRSENERMRFVREARAASKLSHPNIVEVYDISQHKGALYIVMEYVHGASLVPFTILHYRISIETKLWIIVQAADALAYAHGQGITHRDIKPQNIIVQRDQTVKILDFGIAGQTDLPNTLIASCGTPAYMSPEQLRRQPSDSRSDVWALGITLYQLLVGKLPFTAPTEALDLAFPELTDAVPHSAQMNAILVRALSKDPALRYANAADFAGAVRGLLSIVRGSGQREPPHPSAQPPGPAYVLPELHFRMPVGGGLTVRERFFVSPAPGVPWNDPFSLEDLGIGGMVFIGLILVLHFVGKHLPQTLSIAAMLIGPSLIGSALLFARHVLPDFLRSLKAIPCQLPQCQGCQLWMTETASWVRVVKSREETVYGFRDCMAALKHGLWQDAAKLLTIHGGECSSDLPGLINPGRYHIRFYECELCGDHAARLITDERLDSGWEQQAKFGEAYWGHASPKPFLSRVIGAPRSYSRLSLGILRQTQSSFRRIAFAGLTLCVFSLVVGFFMLVLRADAVGVIRQKAGRNTALQPGAMPHVLGGIIGAIPSPRKSTAAPRHPDRGGRNNR